MFAIYYSMVDFFIHGVDLLGGYLFQMNFTEKALINFVY